MNGYFTEILPNIYWFYIYKNHNTIKSHTINEIQLQIKRFCTYKNIVKIIRLDTDTSFWGKNNKYQIEIRKKLLGIESKKLLDYVIKKQFEILSFYKHNQPTLIISTNNMDTGLALFLYIFKHSANMDIKHSIISIKSKLTTPILISDNMKYFISNMIK